MGVKRRSFGISRSHFWKILNTDCCIHWATVARGRARKKFAKIKPVVKLMFHLSQNCLISGFQQWQVRNQHENRAKKFSVKVFVSIVFWGPKGSLKHPWKYLRSSLTFTFYPSKKEGCPLLYLSNTLILPCFLHFLVFLQPKNSQKYL